MQETIMAETSMLLLAHINLFFLLSSAFQDTQEEISHNKRGFHMRLHSGFSCQATILFVVFMVYFSEQQVTWPYWTTEGDACSNTLQYFQWAFTVVSWQDGNCGWAETTFGKLHQVAE